MSVKIYTDSCSDANVNKLKNVTVMPIAITLGEKTFNDCEKEREAFFKAISNGELPKTGQVTQAEFTDKFREELKNDHEILVITLSSKMSGTYNSAVAAKKELDSEKIYVVDSAQASTSLYALIYQADKLVEEGLSAKEIAKKIEDFKNKVTLYCCIYDSSFLVGNGRLKNRAAYVGALLRIKPVITITGGEVVAVNKCIGEKQANITLKKLAEKHVIDYSLPMFIGYSAKSDNTENLKNILAKSIDIKSAITVKIGCSVGAHIGKDSVSFVFFQK